jgi:hypothetical protein
VNPEGQNSRVTVRAGLGIRDGPIAHSGVIDADYRGEFLTRVFNLGLASVVRHRIDRAVQLVVEPYAALPVDENEEDILDLSEVRHARPGIERPITAIKVLSVAAPVFTSEFGVELVDYMGGGLRSCEAARVSTEGHDLFGMDAVGRIREYLTQTDPAEIEVDKLWNLIEGPELSAKAKELLTTLAAGRHGATICHTTATFRIHLPIFVAQELRAHWVHKDQLYSDFSSGERHQADDGSGRVRRGPFATGWSSPRLPRATWRATLPSA